MSAVATQLRKGVLEYCVLAMLERRPRYGFELVQLLRQEDGLLTSEGTIYPLLSRMRGEDMVATRWQESNEGPPRRYYHLTATGLQTLQAFRKEWIRFRNVVDKMLRTGGDR